MWLDVINFTCAYVLRRVVVWENSLLGTFLFHLHIRPATMQVGDFICEFKKGASPFFWCEFWTFSDQKGTSENTSCKQEVAKYFAWRQSSYVFGNNVT